MSSVNDLWLASASPRRRLLLKDAGIDVAVHPPDIDDGRLRPGAVSAEQWVVSLAYLKARRVAELLAGRWEPDQTGTILAADTVCVNGCRLLGQPTDAAHARWMIESLQGNAHHTLTGVCLLTIDAAGRIGHWILLYDKVEVRIGHLSEAQIDAYVQSCRWKGKAGAYNLAEQLEAGWPIQCNGDPSTVMGLPMRKLHVLLTKHQ